MICPRLLVCLGLLGMFGTAPSSMADERLKDIACRSVHLAYGGSDAIQFTSEVRVEQSAPGSYFVVCGWNAGYFGMQELANGKKLVLFSVWDQAKGDDPNAVEEEVRVKLLYQDPAVRVKRFGGEGTGGQSFFDFDWQIDQTYRFLVASRPNGKRTEYTGYFYIPADKRWKKLVTFSTITGGKNMGGFYAFVEDFKRDRESTRHTRRAQFGNGWMQLANGQWQPVLSARFTADANPVVNINAGISGKNQFYLATGGDITNTDVPLRETIQLDASLAGQLPADLAELENVQQP